MPAKQLDSDSAVAGRLCKRCKASEACIIARQEPHCRDCFMNYVRTKAVKRMESFAFTVRNCRATQNEHRLLLPVSFGVSSTTLVAILHEQLERQRIKSGRTGYSLHILFVDTSTVERGTPEVPRLEQLRDAFPGHDYSSVDLASIYDDREEVIKDFPNAPKPEVENASVDPKEKLEKLVLSLSSVTARADVISILRRRVIVRFAQANNYSDILWGDSTTTLAARALAETAKGRGFALPWLVADGVLPSGVAFKYPLQDVFKKELVAYADMSSSSPLKQLIQPEPAVDVAVSAKNTTIDGLMRQYFDSVQKDYPGIVANVARTSSRLESASAADGQCQLCLMPVADGRFGIHGWGGDQDNSTNPQGAKLCYGCTRSARNVAMT